MPRIHLSENPEESRTRAVAFDFPDVEIGIAEYDEGPTGCTVLHCPRGAACAMDVRGGAPGVIGGYARADAICFAGGSLYGLEAVSGVAAELLSRKGNVAQWGQIAVVSGAIIFDFGVRDNTIYPDKELGRQALVAARPGLCPVGPRGAGRSASVGKLYQVPAVRPERGGQGAAFRDLAGSDVKILVVSVVNALGVIVDRAGTVVRGCLDPASGRRLHPRDLLDPERHGPAPFGASEPPSAEPSQNTTLTAVVTNKRLSPFALTQLARQVHASMARAIQPFHTQRDGDVLFALSTNGVAEEALDDWALAEIASDLAWDAVLNAVHADGSA